MNNAISWIKKYWLALWIMAQPLLDVFAFWTASDSGTLSGYIRLAVMVVIAVAVLIRGRRNIEVIIAFSVTALVFGLHVVNGFRIGYQNFFADISYLVKVAYMPVMAICLSALIKCDETRDSVLKALLVNAVLETVIILLSYVTGTYTETYPKVCADMSGLGISGWVIESNRCCHSDIISTLAIFSVYFAVKTEKKWLGALIPMIAIVVLLTNGTNAAFMTLLVLLAGFPVFLVFRRLVRREKMTSAEKSVSLIMAALLVMTIAIYPKTPRYKMEELEHMSSGDMQGQFVARMNEMGYDIENMSYEEKMTDPVVHRELSEYYMLFVYGGIPDSVIERFTLDQIIEQYQGSIDASWLSDYRVQKQMYAQMMFEACDPMTRFTGFEFATIGPDLNMDLENDWYALFYYYGYLGFAAILAGILFLAIRVIRLLFRDFRGSISKLNFALLLAFLLSLGLAYFSGAVLRRPNCSIYLSIIIGLIYYETEVETV